MEYAIGTIGLRLAISSINGISDAARNISFLGSSLYTSVDANKEIIRYLAQIDIVNTIKVLDTMLKEMNIGKDTPNTLVTCLSAIHDTIVEIEQEIRDIQMRLEYNRSLYIGRGFRSYKFHNSKARMALLHEKLVARKDLFFKILPLQKNLHKTDKPMILHDSWIAAEENVVA